MMRETYALLRSEGIENPLFYGTHTPTVFNKRKVLELASRFAGKQYMIRDVYHNLYGPEGEYRLDVKRYNENERITETDYLSSSDSFAHTLTFRRFIKSRFPRPCYYEAV